MRSTLPLVFASSLGAAGLALAVVSAQGCHDASKDGVPATSDAGATGATGDGKTPGSKAQGTHPEDGALAFGPSDAGAQGPPRLASMFMEAQILSEMEWPEKDKDRAARWARGDRTPDRVVRLGYLRYGASAPVLPEAHVAPNCTDGWYELVAGGFVCGRYATLDFNHPRVRFAPHAPDMVNALPYRYGYNMSHGTPLYRQIPPKKDRVHFEPWLGPRPKAKPRPLIAVDAPASGELSLDAGAASMLTGLAIASTRDPLGLGIDDDAGTPWYLRDFDGGKPQISLDELRGEGPMI
ncbi:hypothetical protein EON77_10170, partial [bacterium]